jgi:hypothetical protein
LRLTIADCDVGKTRRRLAADKDEMTNTAREKQQPQDTVLSIELFSVISSNVLHGKGIRYSFW